jgi:HEAT repeat protein
MLRRTERVLPGVLALTILVLQGCQGPAAPSVPPGGAGPEPVAVSGREVEASGLLAQLDAAVRELPTERYEIEHPHRDLWVSVDRPSLAELLDREVDATLLSTCRRALTGDDRAVAATAALVAAWHGDAGAATYARAFLADSSATVRGSAALALGMSAIAPGGVDPGLATELGRILVADERYEVRASAAWSLGQLGAHDAVPELFAAAMTRAPGGRAIALRVAALEALGRIGGEDAIDGISACLAPAVESDVRVAAANALGASLDARAVPSLLDALAFSPPPRVLRAIEQSLAQITFGGGPPSVGMGGSTTRQALELWDRWWTEHGEEGMAAWRASALERTLGPVSPEASQDRIPVLVLMLESPFPWQRRLAHESLAELAGGETPIHPRALYSSAYPASCQATREWQLWARREADRTP